MGGKKTLGRVVLWGDWEGETHAGRVSAVALVAGGTLADDFAVCVSFFVEVDVAGSWRGGRG